MNNVFNFQKCAQIGIIVFICSFSLISCSKEESQEDETNEILNTEQVEVYRSEYESVGDLIYDINDNSEGQNEYSIKSGNSNGYYDINSSSGEISIKKIIPDEFNRIEKHTLIVKINKTEYKLTIVDAFDFYLDKLPNNAIVLDGHNDVSIDENSSWTAMNNLWGKGDAVPNEDFRIATISHSSLPNGTVLIWDVPSNASAFNGAAVWCYNNVFWGNRKNVRENLTGFPFQIKAINNLSLDFEIEQLFGNDQFKIAMNMFMTDENELTKFSNNDGDFFFVFDQKGTFIPKYSHTLDDISLDGKDFAVRYDLNTSNQYERRRVIVKDNEQYLKGNLDIKNLFDMFSSKGFLNTSQYIYHIQFGIEVTSGWGAVEFKELVLKHN